MSSDLDDIRHALAADYAVIRELGRGGMATVYLADDLKRGGLVAVKVLEPDLAGSVGHDRFLREIKIASTLQHPGILTVQDSGDADGVLYYVMRYVEGESLRDRLQRERQLSIEEALKIATEVAEALDFAHKQGFVHRDIKPDNIMLSGGHALLADFGIARAVDQAGTEKLTETGLAVGTPAYMSPEQWAGGNERVDGRSDLYALGCVTYEMLVGETPFTGPTAQVILARHSMADVPSLRIARGTVSLPVEEAVRRAMAKVPSDRFATMGEFAKALATPETEAHRAAYSVRTAKTGPTPTRGRMIRVAAILSVLFVAIVGAAVYAKFGFGGGANSNRIVVLPLLNLGAPDDQYFADGITEEITARLSGVASLGVIARTSAMQYRSTTKSPEQIGKELGVAHLIEGSIRWDRAATSSPAVRVSIRLIRIRDGSQLWSTDLTVALKQVIEVQNTVATKVVQALDVAVLEPERRRLAAKPTDNPDAYDFYLRGNSFYNKSWERGDVDSAIAMYQRATQADPKFGLAWAQLGKTHAWAYRLAFDESPARLDSSRVAIAKAVELAPNIPETHIAAGLYKYWGEWKFDEATALLEKAKAIQPSNAWVYLQLGNIARRQAQWNPALAAYANAAEFDPRFHIIWYNIGAVHQQIRQFDSAEVNLNRALQLQPTFLDAHITKMLVALGKTGDAPRARRLLDSAAAVVPPERWRPLPGHWLTGSMRMTYPVTADRRAKIRAGAFGLDSALAWIARAEVLVEEGATAAAKTTADSAVQALEREYLNTPKIAWVSAALGTAWALAGNKEKAIAAVQRAQALQSDAVDGPAWVVTEAHIQLLVGNRKEALDAIERVVKTPGTLSAAAIKLDPAYASLRADPRFKQILATGSPPIPAR